MIGLIATACEPSSATQPAPGESPLVRPTPTVHRVEIGLGGSVELPDQGIGISFDRVVEDSRCPTNVVCVWAGEAVIELTVTGADTSAVVRLSLEPGSGIESPWVRVASSQPGSEDISVRVTSLEGEGPTAVQSWLTEGSVRPGRLALAKHFGSFSARATLRCPHHHKREDREPGPADSDGGLANRVIGPFYPDRH